MITIKTAELLGAALDWAIAQIEHVAVTVNGEFPEKVFIGDKKGLIKALYKPSTDWAQGGPLIDKFNVLLGASLGTPLAICRVATDRGMRESQCEGSTKLIAAMRAIVAAHFGDELLIPKELA